MQYISVIIMALLSLTVHAEDLKSFCRNQPLGYQNEEALQTDPNCPQLTELSKVLNDLCGKIKAGTIDEQTAKATWERTVIEIVQADMHPKPAPKRRPFWLFGTF